MKPIIALRLAGEDVPVSGLNLVLELNKCGLGFVTALTDRDVTGELVRLDLGYNTSVYRWFTGFVERCAPAENGAQRLFIRELVGVFERHWPISLQHPTLRDVIAQLESSTSMRFSLPAAQYADTPIPHFTHSGSGYLLLANLGRAFAIPDYTWFQLPDGEVYIGSYADSRFANTPVEIPREFSTAGGAGNTQTLPVIPAIRPGVIVNDRRITKVAIDNDEMSLTWTPLNASGQPAQKPPAQRQIEQYYPELGAGLHLPRLARVMSANDSAALGDQSDPFRPRYAVNLQLLDENGNPAADTPEYNAVPLPVPMAGAEGGMFQYPPAGAVVEIGFAEGRPDKPVIRQTMQDGMALPDIKPGEQLQQQRAGVSQRVTTDGSWQRETDQTIQERSSQRHITSDAETRTTTTRTITVNGTDTITVLGTHKLLAGAVVALADGDYAIGTSANMLIRSSKDRNDYVGQNYNSEVAGALTERIAGIRRSVAAQQELIAPSIRLGSDQLNVLTLLTDTLDVLHTLAQQTASHTHNNTGAPLNAGAINNTGQRATALREKYGPFIA
ncbi:hypothetical protein [Pectobacterium aquaticum]|uniref:hypothetical protein n=1 Tax=Pectobacterium aquaticum TaxID=2204145 RepID=UPI000E22750B|nr:hypothetical protein [Pectobacterium aquaticum]UEM40089.1 hypothetical protein DMB82_0003390 [Pectobacterium aquaticum]